MIDRFLISSFIGSICIKYKECLQIHVKWSND